MSMQAIGKGFGNEQAAGLAVAAGADVVLDPPDPEAALRGIHAAVDAGAIRVDQLERSVLRILRAKARLGLDRARLVDVEAVPARSGDARNAAVADEIAARAITLVKDERALVPLRPPQGARALLLSLVDYASGWREGPAGTRARPRVEEALPRPDGGRADRPRHGRRDRPRERTRPPLRRDRCRDVRARGVLQRAHGPLARAAGPSRNAAPPTRRSRS